MSGVIPWRPKGEPGISRFRIAAFASSGMTAENGKRIFVALQQDPHSPPC